MTGVEKKPSYPFLFKVLFEYSEEFPPLLNLVGMASKVINFSDGSKVAKKKFGQVQEVGAPSPFLGHVLPGEVVQVYESH